MNLCRFDNDRLGVVEGERVVDVTAALDVLPQSSWPFPNHDVVIEHLVRIRERIAALTQPKKTFALADVALHSPVANPGKLIAAPVNYRAHVAEATADREINVMPDRPILTIGDAGLFLKATSSLVGPAAGIELEFPARRTDHEVELAVVIGKKCKDLDEAEALGVVAGYCIGLDITVRGSEDRSFRKSADTYSVLGPWLTTADCIRDPDALALELKVNGAVRQSSNTSQLIYGVAKLIAWASEWYTLYPGDVIFTGTPEGVGRIAAGDVIDASIEGIGSMQVLTRAARG
jgi:2-keto-4-pentenoate hydratase/2-oxohepta-3-ene-1,7-dioic acid hydratase in catechol pathway